MSRSGGCAIGSLIALALIGCSSGRTEADDPLAEDRPAIRAADPTRASPTSGRAGSGARSAPTAPEAQGPLVLPRAVLNVVLDAGPGAFLAEVPLQPVRDNAGKFAGFAVVSIFGGHPTAARFGVRPGDVLLQVAGQKLVTPGDLAAIFAKLRSADELVVQVRRRGQPLTFRCQITDAEPAAAPEAP